MPGDIGRYQIDYIMVRQRYWNSVKSSWSYPGADVNSDHNFVAMRVNVKLKKVKKDRRQEKRAMDKLKTNEEALRKSIEERMKCEPGATVEKRWKELKEE